MTDWRQDIFGRITRPEQPGEVWVLVFQVDVTVDGRQVRFCNVVDEFTREALATAAAGRGARMTPPSCSTRSSL